MDFSLEGYRTVFNTPTIWIGYRNSILYTIGGTLINLFMTLIAVSCLSRSSLMNWGLSFEDYDADDEDAFDDFMPDDIPANHPANQPADPLAFLKMVLQDGPLDRNRIENLAKEAGIKMNRLYRIREEAGVVIEKQGNKSSVWRLDNYTT